MASDKRPQLQENNFLGRPKPAGNGRQNHSERPPSLGRELMLMALWLVIIGSLLLRNPSQQEVSYSEFIRQVESGEVATAIVGPEQIQYSLKSDTADLPADPQETKPVPSRWKTRPIAADAELPQLLRDNQVEFSGAPARGNGGFWNWLWMILLISVGWNLFTNRSQTLSGAMLPMGKSNARIYAEGTTGVTFDDVAGVDEAKVELREIVDFLQHTEKYTRLGAKIPTGVLLVGPPGTGKTLLARAIAGEAKVPFFSISASEFIEMFVGVGASRVRSLFEQAKGKAPCIVFIDELDALGKSRSAGPMSGGHDEREQTLNQLLSEMDGFDPNTGVILLAATNRPEVLDPALLRPGRFDRRVLVDRPDRLGRRAILDIHAMRVILAPDVDLDKLAARTPGFAGADLANLVNEAALLAARRNAQAVAMADFNEALERVLTGIEKKSRVLNELEKQTVAYHEVGHAIVGQLMPGAGTVEKISIVPRGIGALGYTLQMPEEDRFLMMEDEIRGRLATLLGGRAAEEFIFGKVSTGASDDIQKATELAERFATLYGMSKELGPIAFEKSQQQFLEGYGSSRRTVSPTVEEAIDQAIEQLMDSAHIMALKVLSHNRLLLETMAQELLEHEILEGPKFKVELQKVQRPIQLQAWLDTGQLTEIGFKTIERSPRVGSRIGSRSR